MTDDACANAGTPTGTGTAYDARAVARMALAIDHVGTWNAAVQTESRLALESAESFKTDILFVKVHGYMLALALRNLLRAVKWAIREADDTKDGERSRALRHALESFDRGLPNAVKFRDVVQYLDDYDRQSSKRHHKDLKNVNVYLERSAPQTVRLHLADDLDLDVHVAAVAADQLADRFDETVG